MIDGNINLLSNDERDELKKALEIKRDLMSYLNITTFIDKVRDIIDQSEQFDFRSKISRLYIDERQPSFTLKIKDDETYKQLLNGDEKDSRNEVSKMLQTDVIKNISKLLTDCLDNEDSDLFEGISEEIKEFVIANIYVVRTNLKDNNIQLYFFV